MLGIESFIQRQLKTYFISQFDLFIDQNVDKMAIRLCKFHVLVCKRTYKSSYYKSYLCRIAAKFPVNGDCLLTRHCLFSLISKSAAVRGRESFAKPKVVNIMFNIA